MDLQGETQKWVAEHLGEGYYLVYPKTSDHKITMTGADVNERFLIPFAHEIIDLDIYHSDAAHADSVDALSVEMKRDKNSMKIARKRDNFWKKTDITVASYGVKYPPECVFSSCIWTLTMNTTNTDLLYPVLKIRKLSKKEVK